MAVHHPPHLLFRNLSSTATDLSLSPVRTGFSTRRVRATSCGRQFPDVLGVSRHMGADVDQQRLARGRRDQQAGGILGREIEMSMYDAGGSLDDVVRRAEQAIAFDEVDLIMARISARFASRCARSPAIVSPISTLPSIEGGERTPA